MEVAKGMGRQEKGLSICKAWGTAGPMNSKVDYKYTPEVEDFPSGPLLSLKKTKQWEVCLLVLLVRNLAALVPQLKT